MNSSESVTFNSLAMNKNTKTKPNTDLVRWYKIHVHFNSTADCNESALRIAVKLRAAYPAVYFARYCNANTARADFYVKYYATGQRHFPLIRSIIKRAIARGGHRSLDCRIEFRNHVGSDAHAAGFDCVLTLARAFFLSDDGEDERTAADPKLGAALADVIHWMHNMLGFDYVDEARQSLYSLGRVLQIFEDCIKAPLKAVAKN